MSRQCPPSSWRGNDGPDGDGFQTVSSKSQRRSSRVIEDPARSHRGRVDSIRGTRDSTYYITGKMGSLDLENKGHMRTGSVVGFVASHRNKGRTNTEPDAYHIGDIVKVPHVTPSLDPKAMLDSQTVVIDAIGPVIGKMRPAIIVGIFKHSLLCVPVCSSEGRGFSMAVADQCMTLRSWQENGLDWERVPESQYLMFEPGYEHRENSYTNLTQTFPVSYSCPINPLGRLTGKSCDRLQAMWTMTMMKGHKPLASQQGFARAHVEKTKHTGDFEILRRKCLDERSSRRESRRY